MVAADESVHIARIPLLILSIRQICKETCEKLSGANYEVGASTSTVTDSDSQTVCNNSSQVMIGMIDIENRRFIQLYNSPECPETTMNWFFKLLW